MTNQYAFIPCEVSPGQFTNERVITLKLANGTKITLFADQNLVEVRDSQKYLKVTKIESEKKKGKEEELVLLPTEAFESGSRWLRFRDNQLAVP